MRNPHPQSPMVEMKCFSHCTAREVPGSFLKASQVIPVCCQGRETLT